MPVWYINYKAVPTKFSNQPFYVQFDTVLGVATETLPKRMISQRRLTSSAILLSPPPAESCMVTFKLEGAQNSKGLGTQQAMQSSLVERKHIQAPCTAELAGAAVLY